jgi:hypothetical protein
MSPHERECFVSRIRVGYYIVKSQGVTIKVVAPKIEDLFLGDEAYLSAYNEAVSNGLIRTQELEEWKLNNGLWTPKDDEILETVKKDIENNKVKCYEYRHQLSLLETGKKLVSKMEEKQAELLKKKNTYQDYTCEGIAEKTKSTYIFKQTCYNLDGSLFDFEEMGQDPDVWMYLWSQQVLKQHEVREIARTDPWLGYWNLRKHSPLFLNPDNRELTIDQKQVIIWSNMYNSIQEGYEQPEKMVLEDDILLDGWLITQNRKSEEERNKREAEKMLEKKNLGNAQEVFFVAKDEREKQHINNLNSQRSKHIKQERMHTVKSMGKATDLDFKDKQIELRSQQNQMFKNQFRKGR